MSITTISSTNASSLSQLLATMAASKVSSTSGTSGTTATTSTTSTSDTVDISKPAELYSKLQQLAQTDPDKLKEVCADIAKKLKDASSSASGQDAQMYSDLARSSRARLTEEMLANQ